MGFLKRHNTVFFKLFISYITITITITVVLGATSYFYFSSNYKKQLIKINNAMLEHEKNTLELTILKKIESLYVSFSTQQFNPYFNDIMYFFDHSAEGNETKLYNISEYIKTLKANGYSFVNGLHVYIPYSNIIISSSWGVKYLNNASDAAINSIDWFKETSNPPLTGKFIDTRLITNEFSTGFSFNGFTYLRVFPLFSSNVNKPGIIAIDINEDSISNIIRELNLSTNNNTFIVGSSGKIIFHPNSSKLFINLQSVPYIKKVLNNKNISDNFITKVDGVSSMISYTTIGNTGWKIITYTPVNEFYKQAMIIQQGILILCILAIIVGFILTNFFAVKMYNPLKSLIHLAKTLFMGDKNSCIDVIENTGNEYTIINNVINKLSFKVSELEKNIIEYQPIVKHNLILSLFNNTIVSMEELGERLRLADIHFNHPFYSCIIIQLDKKFVESMSIQNNLYARYNIIKVIENLSNSSLMMKAIELSCDSIGVIVNSLEDSNEKITEIAQDIMSFFIGNFGLKLYFAVSAWTNKIQNVFNCYNEALKSLKYKFYFPDDMIIYYQDICGRENSTEKLPSLSTINFVQAIKLQQMDEAIDSIEKISRNLVTGNYSANYCRKKLLDLVDALCNYINNLNIDLSFNTSNLYSDFDKLLNINEYKDWLIKFIKEVFFLLEERKNAHNIEIIEHIKKYIENNLGNQLSLESAAGIAGLNPKYLSKLFKEITGTNFLDYITELRLERARELLLNTDLTIEQICYEIGYSTPAYFIRQFKKTYGDTPNNYRKVYLLVNNE